MKALALQHEVAIIQSDLVFLNILNFALSRDSTWVLQGLFRHLVVILPKLHQDPEIVGFTVQLSSFSFYNLSPAVHVIS